MSPKLTSPAITSSSLKTVSLLWELINFSYPGLKHHSRTALSNMAVASHGKLLKFKLVKITLKIQSHQPHFKSSIVTLVTCYCSGQWIHRTIPSSQVVLLDSRALRYILLIGQLDSQVISQCLPLFCLFSIKCLIQRLSIMTKSKHISKTHIKKHSN